jgi:MFS family permease
MLYFGSVLIVFTLMMASLCKEYYQFILAQGVLLGISLAIVFTTSTIYVGLWFNKKRGTAIGLIAPGGPLAGIILPIAISQMLSHTNLGFGWTMRMVGFICIPPLAIACALIRPPPSMDARISSREPESGMNQEVPKEASTEQHEELNNTPVATQRQTVWAVMKKPALFLTCLALFVTYFAINVPLFFVSSYTLSKGFSSGLAFYSVSLVNAGSLCGRFLMGVLSDRYGKFNCITLVAAAGGIISLFWTLVNGIPGLVIFSFCYGFCEGVCQFILYL